MGLQEELALESVICPVLFPFDHTHVQNVSHCRLMYLVKEENIGLTEKVRSPVRKIVKSLKYEGSLRAFCVSRPSSLRRLRF